MSYPEIKVCALSDIHMRGIEVPPCDLLLFAGDATHKGRVEEVRWFGNWLKKQPAYFKIIIAGNHDWLFQTDKEQALSFMPDDVIYLEDERTRFSKASRIIKIHGSPWQPEFYNWAFNLPRGQALRDKWKLIPENLDILITHGPPMGIMDEVYDNFGNVAHVGDQDLLEEIMIKKPKHVVFGHIHRDKGCIRQVVENGVTFHNVAICDEKYFPVHPVEVFDV